MKSLLIAAALMADPAATTADLGWMAGYWLDCDGKHVAESWTWLGGDTLTGVGTTRGESRTSFEFLIVRPGQDGTPTYYAMPGGAPPTPFALTALDGQSATFENPENDFPQTIRYAREGDVMTARIEGMMDGETQSMDWTFRKAEAGSACPAA